MIALTGLVALLCGLASGASAGTLYTNTYQDKQVAALSIGADGLLTPVAGSPFGVPSYPSGLAITPDGRTMVVSFLFSPSIGSYALGSTGALAPIGAPAVAPVQGLPAISPNDRFLYAPLEGGGLGVYSIDGGGSLARIGGVFGNGDSSVPALTPDGRFLFFGDSENQAVERFAIQADGTPALLGSTPAGAMALNGIGVTPDGKFAIVYRSPSFENDELRSFAIGADGSLTAASPWVETVGGVSSPPAIAPSGRSFYIANGNEESISLFSIGADGALSEVGTPAPAFDHPSAIALSADGRFLYAQPPMGETVQAFAVAADGALSKLGAPTPTGGESDGQTPLVRPAAPTAGTLTAEPASPGKKASFDVSGSTDAGATITGYSWDFGDGTAFTTPVPKAQHTFKTGVFDVKVTVRDDANCTGFVYTGQTAYCNATGAQATVKVDTLPVIQGMAATPKRFPTLAKTHSAGISAKGKKQRGGTTFHYKLTETAKVSVAIQRKLSGRKVGKACKQPTKANAKKRKCTRLKTLGSLVAKGKAGKNKLRFSGKLRGKPLPPGRYLATATAVDSAKGKSTPRSTSFEVLPPR